MCKVTIPHRLTAEPPLHKGAIFSQKISFILYHFLQKFTMILQFAAGNAIIGRKAREQLLSTQLFPFLRPMRTAPALRLARGAAN